MLRRKDLESMSNEADLPKSMVSDVAIQKFGKRIELKVHDDVVEKIARIWDGRLYHGLDIGQSIRSLKKDPSRTSALAETSEESKGASRV
jgi:hypothetical protein